MPVDDENQFSDRGLNNTLRTNRLVSVLNSFDALICGKLLSRRFFVPSPRISKYYELYGSLFPASLPPLSVFLSCFPPSSFVVVAAVIIIAAAAAAAAAVVMCGNRLVRASRIKSGSSKVRICFGADGN